jgi:acetylornithine/N-succinyldiaminopimelate aminotransferase
VTAPLLQEVRGRGLWLALVVDDGSAPAVEKAARDAGFIVNAVAPDAVRLAPPLVLDDAQSRTFTDALPAILDSAAAAVKVGEESAQPVAARERTTPR